MSIVILERNGVICSTQKVSSTLFCEENHKKSIIINYFNHLRPYKKFPAFKENFISDWFPVYYIDEIDSLKYAGENVPSNELVAPCRKPETWIYKN